MKDLILYNCNHCGTQGVLPTAEGKCPNCKLDLAGSDHYNPNKIKEEVQKPRLSKLAISAFVLAIISTFSFIITLNTINMLLVIDLLTVPLAAIFGIISILKIKRSRGHLKGMNCAVGSLIIIIPLSAFLSYGLVIGIKTVTEETRKKACQANMNALHKALSMYANVNDHEYPQPNRWCDLLIENGYVEKHDFLCPSAVSKGDMGPCHYAINPNCRDPFARSGLVLLFETKGGWNQFGDRELLSTENHRGKGCNVLFNDGYVSFEEDYSMPATFSIPWHSQGRQ